MRYVDGDALYERACELEAQALSYINTISNDENNDEWKLWNAILIERTAFKHDIYDDPTIEPKRLRWEQKIEKASIHRYGNDVCCSILDHALNRTFGYKFCPMCGASLTVRIEKQKGERDEAD